MTVERARGGSGRGRAATTRRLRPGGAPVATTRLRRALAHGARGAVRRAGEEHRRNTGAVASGTGDEQVTGPLRNRELSGNPGPVRRCQLTPGTMGAEGP